MKIGFVGLGIMGKPMSKNLLKAGHEVIVCDIVRAVVDELVAAGAKAAASPRDIAPQVELVITMLPNSPEVKQVVLGKDGILEGAKAGLIVADMSSIAPLVSREVAAKLAEKGVEMLDAPVSGGQPKAIDGTLSVMVGGKQEVFDRCLPVFKAMAKDEPDYIGSDCPMAGHHIAQGMEQAGTPAKSLMHPLSLVRHAYGLD